MAGPPFALLAICHQSKQEQLQPKRKVQAIVISLELARAAGRAPKRLALGAWLVWLVR